MRNEILFLTSLVLTVTLCSCEEKGESTKIQYKQVPLQDIQKSYEKEYKWNRNAIKDSIQLYVDSSQNIYPTETDKDTISLNMQLQNKAMSIKKLIKLVRDIPVSEFPNGASFKQSAIDLLLFYSTSLEGYYKKALQLEVQYKDDPEGLKRSMHSMYMNTIKEDEKIRLANYVEKREAF